VEGNFNGTEVDLQASNILLLLHDDLLLLGAKTSLLLLELDLSFTSFLLALTILVFLLKIALLLLLSGNRMRLYVPGYLFQRGRVI